MQFSRTRVTPASRTNAAVERREASALRHWAPDASRRHLRAYWHAQGAAIRTERLSALYPLACAREREDGAAWCASRWGTTNRAAKHWLNRVPRAVQRARDMHIGCLTGED